MMMPIKNLEQDSLTRLLKNSNKVRPSVILALPAWNAYDPQVILLLEKLDTYFKSKASFYTLTTKLEDEFSIKYGLRNVPTLFIFDSKNILVAQTFGNYDFNYLVEIIQPCV